ncbi:septum site-determining protein MinC [Apilactobacillus xinyiensis]|uniref:Probable septum site-determining protein MinC n=1 Tax=Apilactobacillus xinyiensis TaxID=2841032 RepID=A0ABT0I1U7_9LACO|nr:septum site-determining protein MinC [Apilactobacillus xinyiensis]MCK8624692.1 cell division inhibitor [Apilactobacillus xinyiensis]MCL0318807.1 cell division inhibitor [Apilactobacillus xinyiensis]
MQSAVLKGNKNGYEIVINDKASMTEVFQKLTILFGELSHNKALKSAKLLINVNSGLRLLSEEDKNKIRKLANSYKNLLIGKFVSKIVTLEEAHKMVKEHSIETLDTVIRNGQDVFVDGDVLFLGKIHNGGKLVATGNIYLMGESKGILQAGFPNNEDKLIFGNVYFSQQVRVGEQFEVIADSQKVLNISNSVVYVNDLHVLSYGKVDNLKQINPKFFNRIGGI